MRKLISAVRARGGEILDGGAMLKVLVVSMALVVVAFVIVAMNA